MNARLSFPVALLVNPNHEGSARIGPQFLGTELSRHRDAAGEGLPVQPRNDRLPRR
jgi:hypothetical protein